MFRLVIFSCLFLATFVALGQEEKKIPGGHDTNINEVPYHVSVQGDQGYLCGGSIIGSQHIVTAAHCVEGKDPMELKVRAGSGFNTNGGQLLNVESITTHPDYNSATSNFNAAILKLKDSLTFGDSVKDLPLANTEPTEGEIILISGFGNTQEGEEEQATQLQSVAAPVAPREDCENAFKNLDFSDSDMFCAGYPIGQIDVCVGDSGSPAVANGKLAGIVSWGEGCGHSYSPSVYTNVAHIRDWIMNQTLE